MTLHCCLEKIELSGSGHEYLDSLTKWSLPSELGRLLWFAISYLKSPELHCFNHLNCSLSLYVLDFLCIAWLQATNKQCVLAFLADQKENLRDGNNWNDIPGFIGKDL